MVQLRPEFKIQSGTSPFIRLENDNHHRWRLMSDPQTPDSCSCPCNLSPTERDRRDKLPIWWKRPSESGRLSIEATRGCLPIKTASRASRSVWLEIHLHSIGCIPLQSFFIHDVDFIVGFVVCGKHRPRRSESPPGHDADSSCDRHPLSTIISLGWPCADHGD